MGWDQSYTPLTRPRLNPPPGRWPPAGVSDQLQTLAGSHNIACKLHAITEDFQSSREAPKPHFPSFATLPSENLDFHEKSYFYLRRSTRRQSWIPTFWEVPKARKIKEISFEGTSGIPSRSRSVAEGAQAALEQPNLTEEDAQAAQKPTLEHSESILELFGGVQSAPHIGRGESRSTFAKIDFFRIGD